MSLRASAEAWQSNIRKSLLLLDCRVVSTPRNDSRHLTLQTLRTLWTLWTFYYFTIPSGKNLPHADTNFVISFSVGCEPLKISCIRFSPTVFLMQSCASPPNNPATPPAPPIMPPRNPAGPCENDDATPCIICDAPPLAKNIPMPIAPIKIANPMSDHTRKNNDPIILKILSILILSIHASRRLRHYSPRAFL